MNRNAWLLRILLLVTLGGGAGACLDAGSGPAAPLRPGASGAAAGPLRLLAGTPAATVEIVEVLLGSAGGDLAIPGGHSLHVPAGALSQPTLIRASARDGGVRIDFGPHGLVFAPGAEPTLTLSYAAAAGDEDAPGLAVVYLDDAGAIREVLATEADTAANVVRARISHFSTYALATD